MRILHVITGLRRAGAETMLVKLTGELSRRGVETRVVCLIERGPMALELERLGVTVTCLGMRSKFDPIAIVRLIHLLWRLEPDIVQTWLYHADFAGLIAALACGRLRQLIWNIRCADMDFNEEKNAGTGFLVWILAHLSRFPAAVIINSDVGKAYHQRLGYRPRRWVEIPNGFDLERWRPDGAAASRLKDEFGIAQKSLIIGLCGRLAPMKDHAGFLRGIALLGRSSCPHFHAVVVGRGTKSLGPLVDELQLRGCVTLVGERNDLPALLPAFDVFCLSSAYGEGFPNVLGEAMASGVPCVATDVGDVAEIVGDTGRIVPPRDPRALADALRELLEMDANRRHVLGARARRRVVECYSLRRITHMYEEIYRETASPGTGES